MTGGMHAALALIISAGSSAASCGQVDVRTVEEGAVFLHSKLAYFSVCFFNRNNIFLSQQINEKYFQP
jgi:hypothetical protein